MVAFVVWNSVPFTKMLPKPVMVPVAITPLIPAEEELMLEEPLPPHATAKDVIAAATRNPLIFNIIVPL